MIDLFQGVQLQSRKVLQKKTPTITIEEETNEEMNYNQSPNGALHDE